MVALVHEALSAAERARWVDAYERDGVIFPLPLLAPEEAAEALAELEALKHRLGEPRRLDNLHLYFPWMRDIACRPALLDVVEAILGPDVIIVGSVLLAKPPRDPAFASWHQDTNYSIFSLSAWIALADSTAENGCMRVIPGSHAGGRLAHRVSSAAHNMLSGAPEVAVSVDESAAVDVTLRAGQMSLHNSALIHGSGPNGSDTLRVGFVVRFGTSRIPEAKNPIVQVRGQGDCSHLPVAGPPPATLEEGIAARAEAIRRRTWRTPIRTTGILGTWTATDEASPGLARIVLHERDGELFAEAFAAGASGVQSLGEVATTPCPAGPGWLPAQAYGASPAGGDATALTFRVDLDRMKVLFTFYLKGGILVLDAFIQAPSGAHYARELFHLSDSERRADQEARGVDDARRTATPRYRRIPAGEDEAAAPDIDLGPACGEWHNANKESPEVHTLTVIRRDGRTFARLLSDVPHLPSDWGEFEVVPHAAKPGSRDGIGWTATRELGDMDAIVTSYSTRGILVLDAHVRFKPGSRSSDYLVREFFHR